jgi:hypothetical protein
MKAWLAAKTLRRWAKWALGMLMLWCSIQALKRGKRGEDDGSSLSKVLVVVVSVVDKAVAAMRPRRRKESKRMVAVLGRRMRVV